MLAAAIVVSARAFCCTVHARRAKGRGEPCTSVVPALIRESGGRLRELERAHLMWGLWSRTQQNRARCVVAPAQVRLKCASVPTLKIHSTWRRRSCQKTPISELCNGYLIPPLHLQVIPGRRYSIGCPCGHLDYEASMRTDGFSVFLWCSVLQLK